MSMSEYIGSKINKATVCCYDGGSDLNANHNAVTWRFFIRLYIVGNCGFSTELDYEILLPFSYNLCWSHNVD
jgi:hypothetical protein